MSETLEKNDYLSQVSENLEKAQDRAERLEKSYDDQNSMDQSGFDLDREMKLYFQEKNARQVAAKDVAGDLDGENDLADAVMRLKESDENAQKIIDVFNLDKSNNSRSFPQNPVMFEPVQKFYEDQDELGTSWKDLNADFFKSSPEDQLKILRQEEKIYENLISTSSDLKLYDSLVSKEAYVVRYARDKLAMPANLAQVSQIADSDEDYIRALSNDEKKGYITAHVNTLHMVANEGFEATPKDIREANVLCDKYLENADKAYLAMEGNDAKAYMKSVLEREKAFEDIKNSSYGSSALAIRLSEIKIDGNNQDYQKYMAALNYDQNQAEFKNPIYMDEKNKTAEERSLVEPNSVGLSMFRNAVIVEKLEVREKAEENFLKKLNLIKENNPLIDTNNNIIKYMVQVDLMKEAVLDPTKSRLVLAYKDMAKESVENFSSLNGRVPTDEITKEAISLNKQPSFYSRFAVDQFNYDAITEKRHEQEKAQADAEKAEQEQRQGKQRKTPLDEEDERESSGNRVQSTNSKEGKVETRRPSFERFMVVRSEDGKKSLEISAKAITKDEGGAMGVYKDIYASGSSSLKKIFENQSKDGGVPSVALLSVGSLIQEHGKIKSQKDMNNFLCAGGSMGGEFNKQIDKMVKENGPSSLENMIEQAIKVRSSISGKGDKDLNNDDKKIHDSAEMTLRMCLKYARTHRFSKHGKQLQDIYQERHGDIGIFKSDEARAMRLNEMPVAGFQGITPVKENERAGSREPNKIVQEVSKVGIATKMAIGRGFSGMLDLST